MTLLWYFIIGALFAIGEVAVLISLNERPKTKVGIAYAIGYLVAWPIIPIIAVITAVRCRIKPERRIVIDFVEVD